MLASGVLSGLLAAAVALGVAELVAGLTGPLSSPVVAVGGVAIDLTPVPVKDFAIAHFGSNDKFVLETGILSCWRFSPRDRGAGAPLARRTGWPGWRSSARSGSAPR